MIAGGKDLVVGSTAESSVRHKALVLVRKFCKENWTLLKSARETRKRVNCGELQSDTTKVDEFLKRTPWNDLNDNFKTRFQRALSTTPTIAQMIVMKTGSHNIKLEHAKKVWEEVFTANDGGSERPNNQGGNMYTGGQVRPVTVTRVPGTTAPDAQDIFQGGPAKAKQMVENEIVKLAVVIAGKMGDSKPKTLDEAVKYLQGKGIKSWDDLNSALKSAFMNRLNVHRGDIGKLRPNQFKRAEQLEQAGKLFMAVYGPMTAPPPPPTCKTGEKLDASQTKCEPIVCAKGQVLKGDQCVAKFPKFKQADTGEMKSGKPMDIQDSYNTTCDKPEALYKFYLKRTKSDPIKAAKKLKKFCKIPSPEEGVEHRIGKMKKWANTKRPGKTIDDVWYALPAPFRKQLEENNVTKQQFTLYLKKITGQAASDAREPGVAGKPPIPKEPPVQPKPRQKVVMLDFAAGVDAGSCGSKSSPSIDDGNKCKNPGVNLMVRALFNLPKTPKFSLGLYGKGSGGDHETYYAKEDTTKLNPQEGGYYWMWAVGLSGEYMIYNKGPFTLGLNGMLGAGAATYRGFVADQQTLVHVKNVAVMNVEASLVGRVKLFSAGPLTLRAIIEAGGSFVFAVDPREKTTTDGLPTRYKPGFSDNKFKAVLGLSLEF